MERAVSAHGSVEKDIQETDLNTSRSPGRGRAQEGFLEEVLLDLP